MNEIIGFVIKHPYLLSLVLFLVAIIISKPTKRKKLLSIALFAFPFAFVSTKLFEIIFQNPTQFVSMYLLPLFRYTVETPFFENQLVICLTVASVVFAEYKKIGVLFVVLAILLAYNILSMGRATPIDIVGCLLISAFVTFLANKIIEHFY